MVIVRVTVVSSGQVLPYYDTVLYNNSRLLQSIVKKNGRPVTGFRGADPTQPSAGHQVMELVDLG